MTTARLLAAEILIIVLSSALMLFAAAPFTGDRVRMLFVR
jgi:hypothetical protein